MFTDKFTSKILKFTIIVFLFLFSNININAQSLPNILNRTDWGSNEELTQIQLNYGAAENIVVLQYTKTPNLTCDKYIQSLQYFFRTRYGLSDFPAHLVLCDGKIYSVRKYGIDDRLSIASMDKSIAIYYENNDTNKQSLIEVLQVLKMDKSKISFKSMRNDLSTGAKKLSFFDISSPEYFIDILKKVDLNKYYKTIEIKSKGWEIGKTGGISEIKLLIKNTGVRTLYGNISDELFVKAISPLSKTNQSLAYVDSQNWPSFTQSYLSKAETLRPNEEKYFTFKMKYVAGTNIYKFIISNLNGIAYPTTEFEIDLTKKQTIAPLVAYSEDSILGVNLAESTTTSSINSNSVTIQTISSTTTVQTEVLQPKPSNLTTKIEIISPLGFLNVRSKPSQTSSTVLTTVKTGQKFVNLEDSGLWHKISVNGVTGWILEYDQNYNYLKIYAE